VLLQQLVEGQQFSYTCLLDGNGAIFRLGENVCHKHRFDGETGPLCEGTGGVSINNSIPGVVTGNDLRDIPSQIIVPFRDHLTSALGRSPKTFLNLDLIKNTQGRTYLLEVNTRAPGGNTMANLINGLETPVAEVLQAAQEGRLRELTPVFRQGASVVVAAFPSAYPHPFPNHKEGPTLVIPKVAPSSPVRMYTGWVDVLEETNVNVTVRANLYTTMIVQSHAPTLAEARRRVYEWMASVIPHPSPEGFDYRRDIGSGLAVFRD
jgi:phosphoribosylamine-glycine ligase